MTLKHQSTSIDKCRAVRKWRTAIRQVARHLHPNLPPLLYLTDPLRTPAPSHTIGRLPAGSGVIYRHFGAQDRESVAATLADLAISRGLFFIIAADPVLACSIGAHGVHWPEKRLGEARKWHGVFSLNTASAHSRQGIWQAYQAGMDAALLSCVFTSNSPAAKPAIGPARLRTQARRSRLPLYALGGISADTTSSVCQYSGLAAIEGIEQAFGAP